MDNLVRKIQELERDAQTLLDQEKRRRSPRHCSATPGGSELLDDGCKNSPVRKVVGSVTMNYPKSEFFWCPSC